MTSTEPTSESSTNEIPAAAKVGLATCISLVMGNMIGSGIFTLPASLAPYGGLSLWGWGVSTAGAILVALVFAQLSQRYPAVGGPYAYTRRAFGDFAGFLVAWGYWIAVMAGNASIAVAMTGYLGVFFPRLGASPGASAALAVSSLWVLSGVNARGVRQAGFVQLVTTVIKVIPLVLIGTLGFVYFDLDNLRPTLPEGESMLSSVSTTAALTLWAFMGLESSTVPAGDIRDPQRTIPRATMIGVIAASVLYITSTVAVMGVVPPASLASSSAPFADAATAILGSWAGKAIALGAVVSCFGALNGWVLNQGQVPMAAARDGLLPPIFARTNRFGAPAVGLAISSLLVSILILSNYTRGLIGLFTFTILLSTLAALVPFVFTAAARMVLLARERRRDPGTEFWAPALASVGAFIFSMWAIQGAGAEVVYWGFLLLLSGMPIYVWMLWKREAPAEGL